jgi:hypothetical protein
MTSIPITSSDGDEADEGYAIMQRALAETGNVAIGQLIMGGRAHLVGIKALKGGLMLSILRYADELRDFTPYFEGINTKADPEAGKGARQGAGCGARRMGKSPKWDEVRPKASRPRPSPRRTAH